LYNAETKSIITARNVRFIEREFITEFNEEIGTFYDATFCGFYSDLEEEAELTKNSSENKNKENLKNQQKELVIQIGELETSIPTTGNTTVILPRKLRERSKINFPTKHQANHAMLIKERKTYSEAISSEEKSFWIQAMNEEVKSLKEKRTFVIVSKPPATKILDAR